MQVFNFVLDCPDVLKNDQDSLAHVIRLVGWQRRCNFCSQGSLEEVGEIVLDHLAQAVET